MRERGSLHSDNAWRAVDPVNAILNNAYAAREGQCCHALVGAGSDEACGFFRVDQGGRDSLVYDLMELYWLAVDARVLALVGRMTFTYGDCLRISDGQRRLYPQLARAVVTTCRLDQADVTAGGTDLRSLLIGVQLSDT